jgi:hypothetical protein
MKVLEEYTVANTTGYARYRMRITASNGGPSFHFSELQPYGP